MSVKNHTIIYIPHGGGPMPLMGHEGHMSLIRFLEQLPHEIRKPDAVIVISAHWEEKKPCIINRRSPGLLYDYFGFPPETYEIDYPLEGSPDLADDISASLRKNAIEHDFDTERGFDHGVFVPLKLMYPGADIPCVQLSLNRSLDPLSHIELGQALKDITASNLLFLGSGFSFHNMSEFGKYRDDPKNQAFDDWLNETLTDPTVSDVKVLERLIQWENAPFARFCHPREEHLLPLHVCYGMASKKATRVFNDKVLGKTASAFLWQL